MCFYWCVLFLLYSVIPRTFCNTSHELIECTGGYCLPKMMCPNGTYQQFNLQNSNKITLTFAEQDECFDHREVCCRNETKIVVNSECTGGYCVPKELCPDGRSAEKYKGKEFGEMSLTIGLDCQDVSQICCPNAGQYAAPPEMLDQARCGVSNEGYRYKPEGNHTYAQYAEFPWMVVILESSSRSKVTDVIGGGSLVHPKFVLSAAHIFKGNAEWIARFGEWDLFSGKHEIYPTQDVKILPKLFVHPEYIRRGLRNDIALVKLEHEIIYQHHIQPICLPGPHDVFNGQRCISNGWGWDVRSNKYANIMKRIELPVIPRISCERMFRATRFPPSFQLHTSVLCAGGETDADTCEGDGGGPLACRMQDGSYVLAGIVSWGIGCNQPNVPGAYVNVAMFTEWITLILNDA